MIGDIQASGYQIAIEEHAFGDLVDLGCGNAPLTGVYHDRVESYTWADWPDSPHQQFKLDSEVDLNELLPFSDANFDTVLLSDVLEHIAYPDKLMAEIKRILRPGGVAIIGVPFLYGLHEMPHDHHRYTRSRLELFAQDHGLNVVSIDETAGGFLALADLTIKLTWQKKYLRFVAYITHGIATFLRPSKLFQRFNSGLSKVMPLCYIAIYRKP